MSDYDVYLSYAPPDAKLGVAIQQYLTAARLSVAIAPPPPVPNATPHAAPWLAEVGRRINRSRKIVLIITDQTPIGWLKAELDAALRQLDHEVIPVVRAGAPNALPPHLVPIRLESDHGALQSTLARLARRARGTTPPAPRNLPEPRPFPGLRPFGLHDGRWFFGRDRDITEATRELGRGGVRWLRIEGAAGIGKTSFARAGVCGAVLRGACGGPMDWLVVAFRPGLDPMRALVTALIEAFGGRFDAADLESALFKPDGLSQVLSAHLPAHAGILMIIDHIDDLATAQSLNQPGVNQFDGLVGRALAHADLPLLLITTGNTTQSRRTLDVLPKLTEAVPHSVVHTLGGLSLADVKRTIIGPLTQAQLRWPPELIERLIDESTRISGTPGPLAWLLARLHRGTTPTVADYDALGGLRYGPGRALDARLDVLEGTRRDRTLTLMLALISAGRGRDDTPTALSLDDAQAIAGGGPDGLALIRGLAHGAADAPEPLVHIDPADDHVRLLHSELLRIWPRLRGLAATYRIALERRADIERRASSWDGDGRNPGQLPDENRLPIDTGADLPEPHRERLRAILSARARAYIGAAEATHRALEITQQAVQTETQRRLEAELQTTQTEVAVQRHRLKLVFFSAAGGVVLLLALLFMARRDAGESRETLQRARDTHAQTAEALAERTADARDLAESRKALDTERGALAQTVGRARKTAQRASQEAEMLLRFSEESMQTADERLRRWNDAAGVAARREHARWAVDTLNQRLEGMPRTDRLRMLTARMQLHLARTVNLTGPVRSAGGHFKAALATLKPLTGRERPSPAALTVLADVQVAAARFYLKRRGVAPYQDPVLARAAAQGAVNAWRRLVKLYPQHPRNQAGLAAALLQLGEVQLGDKLDATTTLRDAVRAHEALVNAAPKDFDRGFALARSLTRWADALAATGRKAEARAALAQATERFRLTEPLAPEGKRPAWQSARERARRLLGRLSQ